MLPVTGAQRKEPHCPVFLLDHVFLNLSKVISWPYFYHLHDTHPHRSRFVSLHLPPLTPPNQGPLQFKPLWVCASAWSHTSF